MITILLDRYLPLCCKIIKAQNNFDQKPVLLFVSWYASTEPQINKYLKLYEKYDWNIIVLRPFVLYFFWPLFAFAHLDRVVRIIYKHFSLNQPIFIHGISIGAFTSCMLLYHLDRNRPVDGFVFRKRIIGVVLDSFAYGRKEYLINGACTFLSPWPWLVWMLGTAMRAFLWITHHYTFRLLEEVREHAADCLRGLHKEAFQPAVALFYSADDPLCDLESTDNLVNNVSPCISIRVGRWEHSRHAYHLAKHPFAYQHIVSDTVKLAIKEI